MTAPKGFSKRNFSAGQYDREFSATQNEIQQRGMYYSRNIVSSVQGEAKTRPGTKWMLDIDSAAVIVPFRRDTKDLALLFRSGQLDVYEQNDAGILEPFRHGVSETVKWTNTANNTPASSAVQVSGQVTGNDNFYRAFTQSTYEILQNYKQNCMTLPSTPFPRALFQMYFSEGKSLNEINMELLPANGKFTQPDFTQARDWINNVLVQHSDDGKTWTTNRNTRPYNIGGVRTNTPSGARNVTLLSCYIADPEVHKYWRLVVEFRRERMDNNAPFCVRFQDGVKSERRTDAKTFDSPYNMDQLKRLKYSQDYNSLIICDGEHNPYEIELRGNTISITQLDYDFVHDDGVPSCVRHFQNRLFYGGFENKYNRVRGSKFGDYKQFTINSSTINASDPIIADCNQFTSRITDLFGGFNTLYAQTQDGIAFLEDPSGVISTNNLTFTLKCYEGGAGITPTVKDNIMFYVGVDKKKIHAFNWDESIGQFVAPDISQYWQEILKNKISEIHYVSSRDKNILGLLEDGSMFELLYDNGANVIGYFPIDMGGNVYDISVLRNEYEINPYIVVERNGYWVVEQFILPGFMERTDEFMQEQVSKNICTKENIIKTPYFDGWKSLNNEIYEEWQYNQESSTITPLDNEAPTSLVPYIQKTVRLYYGDGINDFVLAKIIENYTETQEIETEIEVTKTINYYGWSYIDSIVATPIQGYTPAITGLYNRYEEGDNLDYVAPYAWSNNKYLCYTVVAHSLKIGAGIKRGGTSHVATVATVTGINGGQVLTQQYSPIPGSLVFNTSFIQIGSVTSGNSNELIYNNKKYFRNEDLDTNRTETHKEKIKTTVTSGSYKVELDRELPQGTIFTKIQLPIDTIGSEESPLVGIIQVQDNGHYIGEFVPKDGIVELDESLYNIQYGYPYRKIMVIQDNSNYLRKKKWGAIALSVMDTMSLQIGAKIDKMEDVMKWKGDDFYNSSPIMRNGILIKNIADSPENDKQLILMTDEGLPFCIRAIETAGEITDRNGN